MSKELEVSQPVSIDKIRSYLETMNMTSNLTKTEINQFIEISSAYGLNPFKREIYATKYGNNFSIIVGFETYLKRAERSGKLAGWSVATSGSINWTNLMQSDLNATITIYRKDWNYPFIHTVYFCEYVQRTKEGQPNKFWKEKPYTMIKKVAMAQGFRLCFSDENGGLPYTSEEIANEHTMEAIIVESNIAPAPAKQIEQVTEEKKRGRPKKEDKPEYDQYEILAFIRTAMTLEELKAIWDKYPVIKTNNVLKDAISERKRLLESMPQGKIYDDIRNAQSDDEIWILIEDVTDVDVLKYAKERIEQLTK
jgi:phage recombination protein Bet